MSKSGSINTSNVLADNPKTEILTTTRTDVEVSIIAFLRSVTNIPQAFNTTLSQNNFPSSRKASENEDINPKKIGRAKRARKVLTNVGSWVARQFLRRIIHNIAGAAWDSLAGDGVDNTYNEDE